MKFAALLIVACAGAASLPAQDTTRTVPRADSARTAERADSARGGLVDRVVAVVGSEAILWSDVLEVIQQQRARGMRLPSDSAAFMALARDILNNLVDEELLVQRAAADTSMAIADADLNATVDEQLRQIRAQGGTDQEFIQALKQSGFGNQEEYRRWLTEQARRRELQQRYVAKMQREGKLISVAVTDAEITQAFERLKGSIGKRPPSVTFRQIVIATTASPAAKAAARAKAESLLVQIRAGADFEQLAKRESADSASRDRGGDLGWNRREVMVPEFGNMMFSLPPGHVSPVVETQYGYHIIRVDRAKPTEVKARHILIKPVYDSADVERTRKLADSVVALWKSGTPYDTLHRRFHDRDEVEGSLDPFPRDSLPESYAKAFAGKGPGAFVDPFPIQDPQRGVPKFVIAQLTDVSEGGEYTLKELRERIRSQLQQERAFRRLIDLLKQETYVAVDLDGATKVKAP
jgi:peptidyl-prolyl cis-trans isomerase SurA